jgi:hypothetical protein
MTSPGLQDGAAPHCPAYSVNATNATDETSETNEAVFIWKLVAGLAPTEKGVRGMK